MKMNETRKLCLFYTSEQGLVDESEVPQSMSEFRFMSTPGHEGSDVGARFLRHSRFTSLLFFLFWQHKNMTPNKKTTPPRQEECKEFVKRTIVKLTKGDGSNKNANIPRTKPVSHLLLWTKYEAKQRREEHKKGERSRNSGESHNRSVRRGRARNKEERF